MRMMVICLAVFLALSGCVSKYKTDTFTVVENPLNANGGFYVMLARDGSYGSRIYANSGRTTTQAIASALSVHADNVEVADQVGDLKKELKRAKS